MKQSSRRYPGEGRLASSLPHLITSSLLFLPTAHAFDIESSSAVYANKHYEYQMVAVLDAPIDRVQAVLRDYERYQQLDSRILEARVTERPADYVAMLETVLHVCFGPFCRDVKRLERVEELPLGLEATADPAHSDVKFGETKVYLSVVDGRTRVSYRTRIVPDFWVPPIPGRRWMLRTLEESTNNIFRSIEQRAQETSSP